jgi:type II secretory pathway component HofQ
MIAGVEVKNRNPELLQFVANKLEKIDMFARNNNGMTCMAIAQAANWPAATEFLESLAKQNDGTSKVAESLFEELDAEEKKKAAARDKKRRQTLRKAAEKRGITVEELERQNAEAAIKEKQAELEREKQSARAEIDEIERRKKAYADFKE